LHYVLAHAVEKVENKKVTCGAFLDIEGAFNSNSHIIIEAAKWHGHEDTICHQNDNTLGKRKLIAILAGENIEESGARGCQ
jgi:hypothetical protein